MPRAGAFFWTVISGLLGSLLRVEAQVNQTVAIPVLDTYLLPRPFNDTFTKPFVNTTTTNATVNATITAARQASFVSFADEFAEILGASPSVDLIASSDRSFAFEAGVWVPYLDQVWFTAFLNPVPGYISILDLNTSRVFQPQLTGPDAKYVANPNGGFFFNGTVYITTFGDNLTSPGIFAIHPETYETREVVNSFFGIPFGGPDDVTFTTSTTTNQSCMFFSDFFLKQEGLTGTWPGPRQLPFAVWRFTPDGNIRAVVSNLDVQVPNGLAVDEEKRYLYVTDGPDISVFGGNYSTEVTQSPGIYQFDLGGEDGCTPQNKRLFGFARQGFANGVKIDDFGRVWTAEYEGIVVRRGSDGKVLGIFNAVEIAKAANIVDVAQVANFALARDQLIYLSYNQIYAIKLGQVVKTGRSK